MKLIKLNAEHFIVVDDSDIKENDFVFVNGNIGRVMSVEEETLLVENTPFNIKDGAQGFLVHECRKITHSTERIEEWVRPDGVSMKVFSEIKEINLYSVKLLTDSAYSKADECANALDWDFEDPCGSGYSSFIDGFVYGYNKAIEVNRYTEEDINKALSWGYHAAKDEARGIGSSGYGTRFFESIKTKPKTEWDVEFVDRRLRLI